MTAPASVAETLRLAKEKIGTPDRWCKWAQARPDKRSIDDVDATDPAAGAWCSLGALRFVDGPHEAAAIRVLVEAITGWGGIYFGDSYVSRFNDKSTTRHRDVMRKFDKAVKLAEAQEAARDQAIKLAEARS